MKSLTTLLFLTTLFAAPAAFAQENTPARPVHTMSIEGRGEYFTAPEVAEISGSVVTTGKSLAAARDPHPAIAANVRALVDGLAGNGLKLENTRYSIEKIYPNQYASSPDVTEAQKKEFYFVATTKFELSTRNLAELSPLISALSRSDLQISTVHFTVKNERQPLIEARKAAARDALEQATAYAKALGVKLVDIRSVTDGDARPLDGEADLMVQINDGTIPLNIVIPDQLNYNASVTVDWTIGGGAIKP